MLKRAVSVILIVAFAAVLCACGSQDNTSTSNTQQNGSGSSQYEYPSLTINIGYAANETHPNHLALERVNELLAERTNNQIQLELLGNGVLGGDDAMLTQVIDGTLDAMISATPGFSTYNALADVASLPYLFSDVESAWAAYDGDFGKMLSDTVINPTGVVCVAWWHNGFRQFTNNVRPIYTPEDFDGIKFRAMPSAALVALIESGGGSSMQLSFSELYSALNQNAVEGQENPLASIELGKFSEVQKYLSLTNHIFNAYNIVFNADLWESFDKEVQDVLWSCINDATEYQRELSIQTEKELLEKFKNDGMEINEADLEAFRAAAEPIWEECLSDYGEEAQALIDAAQKYITE